MNHNNNGLFEVSFLLQLVLYKTIFFKILAGNAAKKVKTSNIRNQIVVVNDKKINLSLTP